MFHPAVLFELFRNKNITILKNQQLIFYITGLGCWHKNQSLQINKRGLDTDRHYEGQTENGNRDAEKCCQLIDERIVDQFAIQRIKNVQVVVVDEVDAVRQSTQRQKASPRQESINES